MDAPRGRGSEGKRRHRGRHRRGGIRRCGRVGVPPPPPMQTQIQRMGGMSSAVIGGICEHSPVVHELVAKFADMTAKETAKEHGWQLKEATAYRQRHRIRQRLVTGAWRDCHEKKIACCPTWTPAPSTHACFATGRRRTHGGEPRKTERSRTPLGRRAWAARQRATGPLAA
jgi:hypothetical protein